MVYEGEGSRSVLLVEGPPIENVFDSDYAFGLGTLFKMSMFDLILYDWKEQYSSLVFHIAEQRLIRICIDSLWDIICD